MEEEYITSQGFSSLDIDGCDNCHSNFYFEDVEVYRGEKFCKKCMAEIEADIKRDEMKDERYEQY